MNWIEIISIIIGALGIGTIIAKILDIWLQIRIEKIEKQKWLRDNQLRAFSKLAKETLSFRLSEGVLDYDNPFKFCGIAAESMLLIEDSEIKDRINSFIVSLDEIFQIEKAGEETPASEYNYIVTESQAIVDLLGSLLLRNKKTSWIKRLFKR